LPDEAAHSQYEMRSFVRSDSGVLYPTGQGRLADPSNPVPSSPLSNLAAPVNVLGNVPGILPKPVRPKIVKEKPKSRPSTAKGARGAAGQPVLGVIAYPGNLTPDVGTGLISEHPSVVAPKEDHRARQSRLDMYDDAIESVLRRVQEADGEVLYEQIVSDFDEEPFVPPIVAAGRSIQERDEREAQIADTIDAVISRTFQDSDQSPSPPPAPVGSPPPCDDEDEIIEVHSISPLRVEVTNDDVLILPPPSPPASSPLPFRSVAERKVMPEEVSEVPTTKRARKPRNRQPPAAVSAYNQEDDFGLSGNQARPSSPEIPSRSKFGISESYVKLEELQPSVQKGEQIADEYDDGGPPLPMDAAESLMKLAGIVPPKRLRISYGSGRDRTVEDSQDGAGEDRGISERKTDDIDDLDLDEGGRRSAASDLLALENRQRSASDERERTRMREIVEEHAEMPDVSASIMETSYKKPSGRRGRPRKEQKKRDKVQKVPVIDSC